VDVKDGADTASLTAHALAQHCPLGREGSQMAEVLWVGSIGLIL